MATIDDIAARVGVSRMTVSRVLNGKAHYSRPTFANRARKIRELAEELNYRPSAAARAMSNRASHVVGALLINTDARFALFNQPIYELLIGLEIGLAELGYVLAIVNVRDVDREEPRSRVFQEKLLDGIVVVGRMPEPVIGHVRGLSPAVVYAETDAWYDRGCIRRDEMAAGRAVAQGLAAAGWDRIVWVGPPLSPTYNHFSEAERREGVASGASQASLGFEVIDTVGRDGAWQEKAACDSRVAQQLIPAIRAGAAIATGDAVTAKRLCDAFAREGMAAGRDFAIACCDDSRIIEQFCPALSRVKFDRYGLGREAAAMLVEQIKNGGTPPASRKVIGPWISGGTVARRN